MYRNCIFCSASLGANDALASIPVGSQLAFDGWKGRLWVVCPRCARWNLAPIEERWEPVEQAEEVFRGARLRVQSENIGLARLPDGTRLIRIGKALPGELAAWRYGAQLLRRRHRYVLGVAGAAGFAGVAMVLPVLSFAGVFGTSSLLGVGLYSHLQTMRQRKVVHRLRTSISETVVRGWQIGGMRLSTTTDGDIQVVVSDLHGIPADFDTSYFTVVAFWHYVATVAGDEARVLLARALVHVNRKGADRDTLESATELLTAKRSSEEYLRATVAAGFSFVTKAWDSLAVPRSLALEMALNEEAERRALEGELAALEQAWREAEEIAAIADALPDPIRLPRWPRR